MRNLWTGTIMFGLTTIPIALGSPNENKDVHFKTLHADCGTPVKEPRWCPSCEVKVENEELTRGYEVSEGSFVTFSDEDLEPLKLLSDKTITIKEFVPSVDPLFFDHNYYVRPPEQLGFGKLYALLRDTMFETGTVAIGQFVMRGKEHLCVIWPTAYVLVLTTLKYWDELRSVPSDWPRIVTAGDERELMRQAIGMLSNPQFTPELYNDELRFNLMRLVAAKIDDKQFSIPAKPEVPQLSADDWMENLRLTVAEISARKEPSSLSN